MLAEVESTPVKIHQPCDECGSSDALSIYDDGHTYCFSCQNYARHEQEYASKGDYQLKKHRPDTTWESRKIS